ncbi:MAG: FAD-dependent oxidoreductase [Legionellales bacterium]
MPLHSHIVIVGAGPIGLALACMIKAMNAASGIQVLEKRVAPTRNNGLKINADSIEPLLKILNQALEKLGPTGKIEHIQELIAIFSQWKDSFIRTREIQSRLTQMAMSMGITVLAGPQYEVTTEKLNLLLNSGGAMAAAAVSTESSPLELQKIFSEATLIIGADGAHSMVRRAIMNGEEEYAEEEVLRHLIELKFQSNSSTKPRSYIMASATSIKEGNLNFETMGHGGTVPHKPVTVHIFVDKTTYDHFRIEDAAGNIKGTYGNSWTLKELQNIQQPEVRAIYNQFNRYLQDLDSRGGSCVNEEISTLQMRVYRSNRCVHLHSSGRYVFLVGDAESGLVLERGFNKGLKGVAVCSDIIHSLTPDNIGDKLDLYAKQMKTIYDSEKSLAVLKNKALKAVESSLFFSHSCHSSSESDESDSDDEYSLGGLTAECLLL